MKNMAEELWLLWAEKKRLLNRLDANINYFELQPW